MKKLLLPLVFTCLATVAYAAAPLWYDDFGGPVSAYADGSITSNALPAGTVWIRHSGTATAPGDALIKNKVLEVAASSPPAPNPLSRQDDVHRNFATQVGIVYASFTFACTNLPNALGTYFASFYTNSSTLPCRVHAMVGNTAVQGPGPNPPTNFVAQAGCFRLGINGGSASLAQRVFPVDLATNTWYQVVVGWNPTGGTIDNVPSLTARLWINPLTSTDTAYNSADSVTGPAANPYTSAFAFRQAGSFGNAFFVISNVAVATTFNDAAQAVGWPTTEVAPAVVYNPKSTNVFLGQAVTLGAVASGQHLADLQYQWQKEDSSSPGTYTNIDVSFNATANSLVFTVASAAASDAGKYRIKVTNPNDGTKTATSTSATVTVFSQTGPDQICGQPTNAAVYFGQTVQLSVCASGEPGESYQWYYNTVSNYSGCAINESSCGATCLNETTSTLTINNVRPANLNTGYYYCTVTAFNTLTTNTVIVNVTASPVPVAASIYDLRGMVDGTFYLPTNTTQPWEVTGVVTTYTNLTAAPNMSIMIQDSTAGIGVFFPGNAANRPEAGDSITVVGTLGNFNSMLQINISATDTSNYLKTNSHNNPLPTPYVLPLSFTNGIGYGGVSNVVRKYTSALITLPNVGFTDAGGTFGTGQLTEIVTNTCGDQFKVFFNAAASGVVSGQPVPTGPASVTGPMSYFLGQTVPDRSSGFELAPTRYVDIVSGATLQPVTIDSITASAIAYSGGAGSQFVLVGSSDVMQGLGSWTRVATNCASPGSFTISTGSGQQFYRISSE
jgi:hypothetical protein